MICFFSSIWFNSWYHHQFQWYKIRFCFVLIIKYLDCKNNKWDDAGVDNCILHRQMKLHIKTICLNTSHRDSKFTKYVLYQKCQNPTFHLHCSQIFPWHNDFFCIWIKYYFQYMPFQKKIVFRKFKWKSFYENMWTWPNKRNKLWISRNIIFKFIGQNAGRTFLSLFTQNRGCVFVCGFVTII